MQFEKGVIKYMDNVKLIELAKEAKTHSYSPYSKFRVGAALLTSDNKVYTGCNIENSSYSATNCAERTAIFKAVSEGSKEFKKIAIVSDSTDFTFPCGICRQVMSEFMPNGEVILSNLNNIIKIYKVNELIPNSFKLNDIDK